MPIGIMVLVIVRNKNDQILILVKTPIYCTRIYYDYSCLLSTSFAHETT